MSILKENQLKDGMIVRIKTKYNADWHNGSISIEDNVWITFVHDDDDNAGLDIIIYVRDFPDQEWNQSDEYRHIIGLEALEPLTRDMNSLKENKYVLVIRDYDDKESLQTKGWRSSTIINEEQKDEIEQSITSILWEYSKLPEEPKEKISDPLATVPNCVIEKLDLEPWDGGIRIREVKEIKIEEKINEIVEVLNVNKLTTKGK